MRLIYTLLIIATFSCTAQAAEMLSDFEDGTLTTSTGGEFVPYANGDNGPSVQDVSVVDTTGLSGVLTKAFKTVVSDGGVYFHYIANPTSRPLITQASGANRFSFEIKLPSNFPQRPDNNIHFGTYTRDPIVNDLYNQGVHYYHYMNIPGSDYWTKVICNTHPQHEVGINIDPGDDPEAWDYYDGFIRFYIANVGADVIAAPWDVYVDDLLFYTEATTENTNNINTIHCTYMGSGRFIIGWHGNSQYAHNGDTYNVYWSTSPITNENYTSANLATGSPFALEDIDYRYNYIEADFTIAQTTGTVYFAIKDLDDESTVVSKIDYAINETPAPTPVASKYTITGGTCTGCQ